jgi:hypothetical protein
MLGLAHHLTFDLWLGALFQLKNTWDYGQETECLPTGWFYC